MEPRLSENAFEPLREAAISDSVLTHPALSTAEAAKTVLARAQMVTEIRDRESDIHEKWARLPEPVAQQEPRADFLQSDSD